MLLIDLSASWVLGLVALALTPMFIELNPLSPCTTLVLILEEVDERVEGELPSCQGWEIRETGLTLTK